MMSAAGNVAAGSMVASLQSVGAVGYVALGTVLPVAVAGGAVAGIGYYCYSNSRKTKHDNESGSGETKNGY